MHQVSDWCSGAAANFGWMREAKRENTRGGLFPMSDKIAGQRCAARRVAMKMAGGCVAPQSRIDPDMPSTASPARTALPAAHFDRNATTPVTDLVH